MGGREKLADSYWQRTSSIRIIRGSFHFPPACARTRAEHPRDHRTRNYRRRKEDLVGVNGFATDLTDIRTARVTKAYDLVPCSMPVQYITRA